MSLPYIKFHNLYLSKILMMDLLPKAELFNSHEGVKVNTSQDNLIGNPILDFTSRASQS